MAKKDEVDKKPKDMVLEALRAVGGEQWLIDYAESNPRGFANLVQKMLPQEVSAKLETSFTLRLNVKKREEVLVEREVEGERKMEGDGLPARLGEGVAEPRRKRSTDRQPPSGLPKNIDKALYSVRQAARDGKTLRESGDGGGKGAGDQHGDRFSRPSRKTDPGPVETQAPETAERKKPNRKNARKRDA